MSPEGKAVSELSQWTAAREDWAERLADNFERRAKSLEDCLPGWSDQRHKTAYIACLEIIIKARRWNCAFVIQSVPAASLRRYNLSMDARAIVEFIDAEILRLQQARSLLKDRTLPSKPAAPTKKRTMSPEGRARIAAAQKARRVRERG